MGFPVRALEINEEKFKSTCDTFMYLAYKANIEWHYGSKDSSLALFDQAQIKCPSNNSAILHYLYQKVLYHNFNRDYTKALETMLKLEEKLLSVRGSVRPDFPTGGFTFLKNGMMEKANYHLEGSIKNAKEEIKLKSAWALRYNSHFNLSIIYAILDDKQKSLYYLEKFKETRSIPIYIIHDLKHSPMFDNVRNEPEFQEITNELEKKYLEEHKKIKKLLIRYGLDPA
jgi:hypothetical protein